jgi:hypothetical protein
MTIEELGRLIERSLKRSRSIEIDGLGVFARNRGGEISFQSSDTARVFIAYASEDRASAERLFDDLAACGYSPWMDRRKLLPGQNWPERIEDAIISSDFFVACFSTKSVRKRGGFQTELRYALDCASSMPLDDVFLIPVRIDDCKLPARIERETHWVDLFPDWRRGFGRIVEMIEQQMRHLA